MHNLISYNQLAGWKQSVERLTKTLDRSMEESDLINDYYNCLIECDTDQATCKRICRRILRQSHTLSRVDNPAFFMYNNSVRVQRMDKEKLKLIIKNLESLVDCLKSEVYSDVDAYKTDPQDFTISDYDEVFYDDDDGYAD